MKSQNLKESPELETQKSFKYSQNNARNMIRERKVRLRKIVTAQKKKIKQILKMKVNQKI